MTYELGDESAAIDMEAVAVAVVAEVVCGVDAVGGVVCPAPAPVLVSAPASEVTAAGTGAAADEATAGGRVESTVIAIPTPTDSAASLALALACRLATAELTAVAATSLGGANEAPTPAGLVVSAFNDEVDATADAGGDSPPALPAAALVRRPVAEASLAGASAAGAEVEVTAAAGAGGVVLEKKFRGVVLVLARAFGSAALPPPVDAAPPPPLRSMTVNPGPNAPPTSLVVEADGDSACRVAPPPRAPSPGPFDPFTACGTASLTGLGPASLTGGPVTLDGDAGSAAAGPTVANPAGSPLAWFPADGRDFSDTEVLVSNLPDEVAEASDAAAETSDLGEVEAARARPDASGLVDWLGWSGLVLK